MRRTLRALGAGLLAAGGATVAVASSAYPPNIYFAFGSVGVTNVINLGGDGNPAGWQCGLFNLAESYKGLEPSQFRGSGGVAAKMFLALGEYYYDPSTEALTQLDEFGDSAVITFTSPTGGDLDFDYGFDINGDQEGNLKFPFRVDNIAIGKNDRSMVIGMTVDLDQCSVSLTGDYYSNLK